MTPQAYLYICDGDIDHPVLTHKKMDWSEKYPHWQEIPLVMAQQAEPVACGYDETTGNCTNNPCCYTSPPPRQPLTDEEIDQLLPEIVSGGTFTVITYGRAVARVIEAAHGIK